MAVDVVAAVADRLEAAQSARTVYRYAVPDGPLPDCYLLVSGNVGETTSSNMGGLADRRDAQVDVKSVAIHPDPLAASRMAGTGAAIVVDALTDWRAVLGRATWLPDHIASHGPTRDESLPGPVYQAVERYVFAYQP